MIKSRRHCMRCKQERPGKQFEHGATATVCFLCLTPDERSMLLSRPQPKHAKPPWFFVRHCIGCKCNRPVALFERPDDPTSNTCDVCALAVLTDDMFVGLNRLQLITLQKRFRRATAVRLGERELPLPSGFPL